MMVLDKVAFDDYNEVERDLLPDFEKEELLPDWYVT